MYNRYHQYCIYRDVDDIKKEICTGHKCNFYHQNWFKKDFVEDLNFKSLKEKTHTRCVFIKTANKKPNSYQGVDLEVVIKTECFFCVSIQENLPK